MLRFDTPPLQSAVFTGFNLYTACFHLYWHCRARVSSSRFFIISISSRLGHNVVVIIVIIIIITIIIITIIIINRITSIGFCFFEIVISAIVIGLCSNLVQLPLPIVQVCLIETWPKGF